MTRDEAQRIAERLVTVAEESQPWSDGCVITSWLIRVSGKIIDAAIGDDRANEIAAELRAAIVRTLTEEPPC